MTVVPLRGKTAVPQWAFDRMDEIRREFPGQLSATMAYRMALELAITDQNAVIRTCEAMSKSLKDQAS